MLNLFRSPAFVDGVLGRLERRRGLWRGTLTLGEAAPTPFALFGSGRSPDAVALAAAHDLVASFSDWRPLIAKALHEHHAAAFGETLAEGVDVGTIAIASFDDVWAYASLNSAAVIRLAGVATAELVYAVRWDDDHLLGARFQSGTLVELCGSVLPA